MEVSVIASRSVSRNMALREVAERMIQKRAGKIINICSLMSDVGRGTTGPYTASKGGLKMLTKAMCADWAQYNIQVNSIGPGYFITEMTQVLAGNRNFDAWVKGPTPARRWGKPEELVGSAVFLGSNGSDFVNGQMIYVDGEMISVL
ncbi:MAG TPA: SDR family oxidoreductase [Chthoniobacterales bacterium]